MANFLERRAERERRDWDMFVYPDRRSGVERRSGHDRRRSEMPFNGADRREAKARIAKPAKPIPTPQHLDLDKEHYTTAEVAEISGLSQTTLLLWIRNKVIDGSRIKRSVEGRRLWTREDIEEVERVKARNGWTA